VKVAQRRVDPAIEPQQRAHLAKVRAPAHIARESNAHNRIEIASKTADATLMPLFIEAVEANCTLGEICGVLRQVWGEYQPKVML